MTNVAVTAPQRPLGKIRPGRLGNTLFGAAAWTFALLVLLLLAGVMVALVIGAIPAFRQFGISYIWTEAWNPVKERYGALAPLYGTLITSNFARTT
jgi:phosphate transport system permease protein